MEQKGGMGSPTHPVINLHPGEGISKERPGTLYLKAQSSEPRTLKSLAVALLLPVFLAEPWALRRALPCSQRLGRLWSQSGLWGTPSLVPLRRTPCFASKPCLPLSPPPALTLAWENTVPAGSLWRETEHRCQLEATQSSKHSQRAPVPSRAELPAGCTPQVRQCSSWALACPTLRLVSALLRAQGPGKGGQGQESDIRFLPQVPQKSQRSSTARD